MDTDEGPLINENSNGLSHLLTEGEFNSVDAVGVDESSASNQGFLNAVELSTGSVGDYLEDNRESFNAESFDVGDNAVTFPSDSLNNVLSDGDSRLSDVAYKTAVETDGDNTLVNNESQQVIELDDEDSKMDQQPERHNVETEDVIPIEEADDVMHVQESERARPDEESEDAILNNYDAKPDNVTTQKECQDAKPSEEIQANDGNEVANTNQDVKVSHTKTTTITDEDSKSKTKEVGGAEETEVVSEDELPTVEKPSVKDAENVSDDELPGPKPAELPADTEVSNLIFPFCIMIC